MAADKGPSGYLVCADEMNGWDIRNQRSLARCLKTFLCLDFVGVNVEE